MRRVILLTFIFLFVFSGLFPLSPGMPNRADASGQDEWNELKKMLSDMTGTYTSPPAKGDVVTDSYTAGQLIGNGDIGVVSDGREGSQTFYFSKNDFWANGQKLGIGGLTIKASSTNGPGTTLSVTASDTRTSSLPPSNTIDGKASTKWDSRSQHDVPGDKWLMLDLGKTENITRWVVWHEGYNNLGDKKYNTRDFKLQKSVDGEIWTDIDTVEDNKDGKTDRIVPAFSARYVRLYITKPVQPGAETHQEPNDRANARIRDIALYSGDESLMPVPDDSDNYLQEQDILNAEVRSRLSIGGEVVNMRTWTADSQNTLVTELRTAQNAEPITLEVDLWTLEKREYPATSGTDDEIIWVTRQSRESPGPNDWISQAAAATRLIGASPSSVTSDKNKATLTFQLEPDQDVKLVTQITGAGSFGEDAEPLSSYLDEVKNQVANLTFDDLEQLHDEHLNWWKDFWLKSYVVLNDNELERYYYGALYALGSSTREGSVPPGLWASWNTTDTGRWGGRYFLNYNYEAPFYGVFSSNRPELAEPYYGPVLAEVPYARNSTSNAGYEGVAFRRSLTPNYMFKEPPAPRPIADSKDYTKLPADQKSNAMFAVIPFIWNYQYTGDLEFFREKTYPFLKEIGDFWLDYLEKDDTGRYVVYHSSAHEGGDDTNPNLDLGYVRLLFETLIKGSQDLGVDEDLRQVWQDRLDNLSDYPTGVYDGKEVFLLAEEVNNPTKPGEIIKGEQPVNLEGAIHPGDHLAIGSDPRLLEIARNTLEYMDPWPPGRRGSTYNGFPKTFTVAARIGWPADDLIAKFKRVINSRWRENLTVFQNGGGIETSGAIETIHSMLLQTNDDVIRVFPNWPEARDAGFVRLRAKGAFLISSEQKNGQVVDIDITSEKGNPLNIVNPWEDEGRIKVYEVKENGKLQEAPFRISDGVLQLDTKSGRAYKIVHTENIPITAAEMNTLVEQFEGEGEFANHGAARSLQVHLTAVSRYEEKRLADKVVKHMNNFKLLLDHQLEKRLISRRAYDVLKSNTDALIKNWQ